MANYVKFKQGLKKDFNTTNQPLTNGMIYFVIDENNNGSIYYDTIVDGKKATKNGTVHRVKFSGLPIKITGSVIGTGVISQDGETIEINTSTNHSHGLAHQDFTVTLSNDDTNLKWTRLGNQNGGGFWLKSIRGQSKAPAWFLPDFSAGIAFGGSDTKGIISVRYSQPGVRFAGGNGDAPVWYFTITGANDKTYDLSKIGGHSSDSAKLDHNVTFKIASTADATNGANGTKTDLSGSAVDLYLPTKISGFDLLQASRFQGNADSATYATSAGYAKGLFLNPETHQEDMNFNLADAKYIKRVTYSMATSTTKKNKPPIGDANILSFGWDNSGYGSQLAIQNGGAGHLAVRGSGSTNGASSWGEWSTILDSSNYTSYINNYYWANVKVSTASSTETKPTFNTAYTSNWWRSTGKTGWWNDTYSGGIAMEDKTYVKVAGNKSFLIPNGSLKIGGNGNVFFATGNDDATLKIYGQTNTEFGTETIAIQTCFDNQDPQTSGYTTQYANRCNLLLQPRGGQVYIGKNLTTPGDPGYKLLVGGNQWIEGNLVFKGAKEIKFIGSKATYSMIRFIDNTSDTYGNGISIGGGGSTVIGAGESAMSYVTNGGDEKLFLLSDGAINIEAGGNTISNRNGLQVTSDGHILPIKAENSNPNTQDLGSAADYWRNLYINNITLQGQTGNRLVWTNGSKILQAGYHYADTDRIAINTAGRQGYNFYVNGSSYFNSNTYINRNYFLNNPSTGAGELILTALGYKSAGYPIYNDPEFAYGSNGVSVYNNSYNGTVTHAIVSDASSGNSSGKVLKITHTGAASPDFGGFYQNISSRANAIFIQIFRAKIPTGRNVATASNSMGDNYKDEWLTPTDGTGRWEWYARRVICGASGTFSTGGHVYITGGTTPTASSPLVWYLSYCNVIDVTKGNYDGLRTRYSDFVTYDSGEDGKDNKTPINDKYVAKIVTKTSNGTTFTLRGLNGANNELADAVLTIPNAGSDKAGLITNAAQGIYGEKTLHENLRFANVSTGIRGIIGTIADNDFWRVVGRADATNSGYLEIATGDDTNEPIYMRQYSGVFGTIKRTFTILDGSGRSRAPELFEAKKVHVNSGLNQSNAIADIGYQFQVTGTSNFTDSVNISGVTTHHNNIQIDANYSIAKPGKGSAWYGSHNNAMIRMTSINGWSPLLAQKATDGYWVLGHYHEGDFKNQWLFGYLADSNLEGTTGASNSLTTTYRLLNIGGNDSQRMFVSAKYNAAVGSGTQPVYIQNNGNVATCSYSLSATIEAGTANRMAYYKAANQIGSSGHYVTSSQVGINSNTTHDFTFYVGGNSYFSNLVTVYAGNNLGVKIGQTNITAIDGSLIFQNNTALRFGSSEWDWNKWAGLKYVPSSKTIVMGLADATNFTANSAQSGGTFLFTGMSSIDLNKTASIKNLAVGGGIYWNPYVESAGDGSDAASITVIAGGVAGGTELRIQQQNDANDVINLVVNNSIFLNGKRAFRPYDSWLRINEDSSFGAGIYTGSSLIRSDNQLQVGDSGNAFYANSSGNGYFSNTLGIAGTNNSYRLYVKGNQGITAITNRTMTLDTANSNKIGTTIGDLHIQPVGVGSGSAITNGNVSSITFGCDNIAYAGIYSPTSGAYGNHLIFATTNSYANGAYGRMIITASGNVGIGTMSPSYKLHVLGDIYANGGWLRTSGATGWYNETYGGGWYMTDSNFIRNYNSKAVSININSNNAWGIGGHRLATVFKGNDHVSILLSTNTLGYGLCVNNDGNWYWGKRTTNSETSTSGDSYILYGSTNYISPYSTNAMDLGLSNRRWRSSHIYRDFNIYGNESTGDESHIRFNASDNTQRAIITFNGNNDNTFKSSTHLKIATSYGDIRLAPANGNVNIGDGNCSLTWRKADNGGVTGGLESGVYYSTPGRESVVFANMYAHTGWIFVNGIRPSNKTNWNSLGVTPAVQIHHNALYINRAVRDADTADYNLYVNGSGYINGRLDACNRSNSASYMESAIQIRERGFGGTQDDTWATAPRLSWHWSGRVQAQIGLGSNGWLYMSRDGSFGDACRLVTERTDFTWNISAHMLDGYHESSFLRYSGWWSGGSGQNINDASGMVFAYSDHGLPGSWGIVTTFEASKDSSYRHQIYGDGWNNEMYFRTCSSDRGGWNAWRHLLDDVNYRGILDGSYVKKSGDTMTGTLSNSAVKGGMWITGTHECTFFSKNATTASAGSYYQGHYGLKTPSGAWSLGILSGSDDLYFVYGTDANYTSGTNTSNTTVHIASNGGIYGAVWNDYAEFRWSKQKNIKSGHVVIETGKGDLVLSSKRMQPGGNIVSDTYGFAIGETKKCKTPIAVSGRVLAYPYEDRDSYQAGDPVCSGPNGTISKMTREEVREYPDRIIGTVSEIPDYEVWGTGNVKVNNRIWIKVK